MKEPGCGRCGKSYKNWDHLFMHNYVRPAQGSRCKRCGEPKSHRKHKGFFGHTFAAPRATKSKGKVKR